MARSAGKRRPNSRARNLTRPADRRTAPGAEAAAPAWRSRRAVGLLIGVVAALVIAGIVVVREDHGGGGEETEALGGQMGVVVPWIKLPDAEQARLDGELARARAATLRYPTVADAEAAGWVVAQDETPIGAHTVDFARYDGTFDIDEPDMLLYRSGAPDAPVVAASYYVVSDSATPPSGFTSSNDHWHRHYGLCFSEAGKLVGQEISSRQCAARGGAQRDDKGGAGWMLHVWIVPGWTNPDGIFAPMNPKLDPSRS